LGQGKDILNLKIQGSQVTAAYFARLPKVELHLHLEGAIPLPSLWQLVEKYGGDPAVPDVSALASKFVYRDFQHFIETWVWKNQFLREYEDFRFISAAVAGDLAAQNIVYAEVFYSPGDCGSRGLEPQKITEAVRQGIDSVPGIEIALITDLVRDYGPEHGGRTLEAIREVRDALGVIGIGIGGSEHRCPPEPFAPIYERARALGFRTTAHAGEASGPESVWGAVRALKVDRIGHGTTVVQDPALMAHLAENRIPLELCPISNLRTGVIPSIDHHPIRIYLDRGIPLSINTDDPKLFNNSLAEEYFALHTDLGFSIPEIHSLIKQGVTSSWLPEERKQELLQRISREIDSMSGQYDERG
jgi:adenosine deaminase